MSRDTTSGSAGQKPSAGATPQLLDTIIGQREKLKSGVVTIGMPKIKDRDGLCGTKGKERKILLSLYYIFQNEMEYVESNQDRINNYQQAKQTSWIYSGIL